MVTVLMKLSWLNSSIMHQYLCHECIPLLSKREMSAKIKVVLSYAVLNDGLFSKSETKKGIDKILSLGFQETCVCECMVTRLKAHNCRAVYILVT